ncbi:hypothetical protein PR048_032985 [Dryococelus australis]|uniref:Microtubule-associated protein n=1 Tax=Dryococelus australis TaxID=614101 RepID=A0ABQ9G4Z1_9NEOP|nr:hypothetical protein PR048_032985 [Dryococelus australis]
MKAAAVIWGNFTPALYISSKQTPMKAIAVIWGNFAPAMYISSKQTPMKATAVIWGNFTPALYISSKQTPMKATAVIWGNFTPALYISSIQSPMKATAVIGVLDTARTNFNNNEPPRETNGAITIEMLTDGGMCRLFTEAYGVEEVYNLGAWLQIEDQKLDIKAQSKVGSLANVKHKPGGGEKKIFDDKDYLKQVKTGSVASSEGRASGAQVSSSSSRRIQRGGSVVDSWIRIPKDAAILMSISQRHSRMLPSYSSCFSEQLAPYLAVDKASCLTYFYRLENYKSFTAKLRNLRRPHTTRPSTTCLRTNSSCNNRRVNAAAPRSRLTAWLVLRQTARRVLGDAGLQANTSHLSSTISSARLTSPCAERRRASSRQPCTLCLQRVLLNMSRRLGEFVPMNNEDMEAHDLSCGYNNRGRGDAVLMHRSPSDLTSQVSSSSCYAGRSTYSPPASQHSVHKYHSRGRGDAVLMHRSPSDLTSQVSSSSCYAGRSTYSPPASQHSVHKYHSRLSRCCEDVFGRRREESMFQTTHNAGLHTRPVSLVGKTTRRLPQHLGAFELKVGLTCSRVCGHRRGLNPSTDTVSSDGSDGININKTEHDEINPIDYSTSKLSEKGFNEEDEEKEVPEIEDDDEKES